MPAIIFRSAGKIALEFQFLATGQNIIPEAAFLSFKGQIGLEKRMYLNGIDCYCCFVHAAHVFSGRSY